MKVYQITRIITALLAIAILVWAVLSWREVMAHQSNTDLAYSAWNLFELLF